MDSTLLTIILSFITGVLGWVIKSRQQKVKLEGEEIDNVAKAIKVWRELSENLERTVKDLTIECQKLRAEVNSLTIQNGLLKQQVEHFEKTFQHNNQ